MHWYWILAAAIVILSSVLHLSGLVRFDTSLHWSAWLVGGLVLLNGGWMAFDGGRALVVGDYVTPKTGQLAGALGPWSKIVAGVGIGPRSTLMKCIFLAYGFAYLAATAAFLLGASSAWWAIVVLAALGLWYIPFGTLINVVVIILLLLPPMRSLGGST